MYAFLYYLATNSKFLNLIFILSSNVIFITGYILIWQHFLYLGEKTTIIWPWKRFLHTYFLCVIFFMKRIAVNCRRFLLHKTFLLLVTPKWRLGFPGFLFYNVQDFMGITKYKRGWYEIDFGGWNVSWLVYIHIAVLYEFNECDIRKTFHNFFHSRKITRIMYFDS